MITFVCGGCGRSFSVPEAFAGRKATCKTCGAPVSVPAMPAPPAPTGPAPKVPLRIRRMRSDALQMASVFRDSPIIRVRHANGDPPDLYEVEYRVRGLERGRGDEPIVREHHVAEIRLPADYPRLAPKCKMLTPIFHPNIDPTSICVGDHWTAGERLADLVIRIGEMITYQAYNIKSPLDAEAAMWADLHATELPVDPRSLRPAEM
jgi:ubiquitin-protein ligase